MSPLLVYLMMQADSIGCMLFACFIIFTLLTGVILFGGAIATDCGTGYGSRDEETWSSCKSYAVRMGILSFIFGTLCALMPSTKTIAVMIVLPKVTSPEALDKISHEAGDIYNIAKDALKNLAKPEEKKDGH